MAKFRNILAQVADFFVENCTFIYFDRLNEILSNALSIINNRWTKKN